MQILRIYSILCLMVICVVEVCDAECDEYVLLLEEYSCPNSSIYMIKTRNRSDINGDIPIEYPCNSTEDDPGKQRCFVEFNCVGTESYCHSHIKAENKQKHYFIADNQTTKPSIIKAEVPDVTTSRTTVTKEPYLTLDEEFKASRYDVSLKFIRENDIQNKSETNINTPQNETLYCDYIETVCLDDIERANNSLSDFKNDTNTHHVGPIKTLQISIDRDETSPVQPVFTGYFPKSSKDSSKNYNGKYKYLKSISIACPIAKHSNCKNKLDINVYLKVNYIENNTITKYPNCTKEPITSNSVLNVKCEDISFVKHNRHIVQTPLTSSPKENVYWTCHIKEFHQSNETNKLYFINCSNKTNISDKPFESEEGMTPLLDINFKTIHNILTKNDTEMNKTESTHTNPENMITFLIAENTNNCSHNTSFNIGEGKIIDLGINNKEYILQNNHVELILSNCINDNSFLINNKEPKENAELTIILKSESLNASNLEQFNGIHEDKIAKQRILLRCDHPINEASTNATSNKTILQCESIDLDFYNITGIEISKNVSETSNTYINKEQKKENMSLVEIIENDKRETHKNIILSTNKTAENNGTINNERHEDNTKIQSKNEVQNFFSEAKEIKKKYKNIELQNLAVTFNRRKDIPNIAVSNSISKSPERENIFLIALLAISGVSILMAIVWRVWPKKREYNPAPTREPADEETAF